MNDDYIGTVNEWVKIVNQDIDVVRHLATHHPLPIEIICFHAQQATEKILKAFLVSNGVVPPKTHNIRHLIEMCQKIKADFVAFCREADTLTQYGVTPRYPTEYDLDETDAKIAISYAEKIVQYVNGLLFPENNKTDT
ncbi:MAG: HEPN domain-containing protein [Oscillospiraceae bacterium]|nr:HEPN domain-containing protein [Oscillospiraceae bacterium]